MFRRGGLFLLLLAGAVGIPYVSAEWSRLAPLVFPPKLASDSSDNSSGSGWNNGYGNTSDGNNSSGAYSSGSQDSSNSRDSSGSRSSGNAYSSGGGYSSGSQYQSGSSTSPSSGNAYSSGGGYSSGSQYQSGSSPSPSSGGSGYSSGSQSAQESGRSAGGFGLGDLFKNGNRESSSQPYSSSRPYQSGGATSAGSSPSAGTSGGARQFAQRAPADEPPSKDTPLVAMEEALRFDITTNWVLGRWPRVTAGLPDASLQGYRVSLVSGTREDDLAGALTYYFNSKQLCEKVVFQGTTGDTRQFVALLRSRFGFERQSGENPGLHLYQVRWNGKPISQLEIWPAAVVRADAPHARFEIILDMRNPAAR